MYVTLILFFLATASAADYSAVIDSILEKTRSDIRDSLPFTQLHYTLKKWNLENLDYESIARLDAVNGHLLLGKFTREGTPEVWGNVNDGILESRFSLDLEVKYDNFTATNFTSGETSHGQMTVKYDRAEMFTWIKFENKGNSCVTSVSTYTPIFMSDPHATVVTNDSKLPSTLFQEAKYTLNFYTNFTLVNVGLPPFANVVSKTNLCVLSS